MSDLISALRLLMIIGLVFVHFGAFPGSTVSPFQGLVNFDNTLPDFLNSFFLYVFLSAVPVLSIISGYLIARNGMPSYFPMLKKKIITLLIPSFIWTFVWVAIAFVLYKAGFAFYDIGFSTQDWWQLFNAATGLFDAPFAYQFWFIHDLVLCILLLPVIYKLTQWLKMYLLLPMAAIWLLELPVMPFFYIKVPFFFVVGLLLCQIDWNLQKGLPYKISSICTFFVLVLLRVLLPAFNDGVMPFETIIEFALRLVGALAMVHIVVAISLSLPAIYGFLVKYSGMAFLVFAAHYPTVIVIKSLVGGQALFQTTIGQIVLWFATPVLTVVMIMVFFLLLNIKLQSVVQLLSGQRQVVAND